VFWIQVAVFASCLVIWLNLFLKLPLGFVEQIDPRAFPLLLLALFFLGVVLLVLAVKEKAQRGRWYFLITGGASVATGGGVILHNLLEALAGKTADWPVVSYPMELLGVAFFFLGITAPLVFMLALIATAGHLFGFWGRKS
jgi:hypothetical protein